MTTNYWSPYISKTFSELISKLIDTNKDLYLLLNNLYNADHVNEDVKDDIRKEIIDRHIYINTMIQKFKYVLYNQDFAYHLVHIRYKLHLEEYNLSKLYTCLNNNIFILKYFKDKYMTLNIDTKPLSPYPNNPDTINFENLSKNFEKILNFEKCVLGIKISEILDNSSNYQSENLEKIIEEQNTKILDGEKIMLRLKKAIFSKGNISNPIDEGGNIIEAINNYCK